MLIQLSIRDIVLIERLDLAFESGLSVLTGETGAGKSILLDRLSPALGGRGVTWHAVLLSGVCRPGLSGSVGGPDCLTGGSGSGANVSSLSPG